MTELPAEWRQFLGHQEIPIRLRIEHKCNGELHSFVDGTERFPRRELLASALLERVATTSISMLLQKTLHMSQSLAECKMRL
ncbi:MAG: hypothetical protein ACXWAX_10015, partial [Chthoniobacterales bacterium]